MPFIVYEKFLTQNDRQVCGVCAPFHGQIFKQGEGPRPGLVQTQDIASHPGCRCRRVHHTTEFIPDIPPIIIIPAPPEPKDKEE